MEKSKIGKNWKKDRGDKIDKTENCTELKIEKLDKIEKLKIRKNEKLDKT